MKSSPSDLRLCWSIRVRAMPVSPLSFFFCLCLLPLVFLSSSSFLLLLLPHCIPFLLIPLLHSPSYIPPRSCLHCHSPAPLLLFSIRYLPPSIYPTHHNGHVFKNCKRALLLDPGPHLLLSLHLDVCQHCPLKVLSTFPSCLPSRIFLLDSNNDYNNNNHTRTGSDRYQKSTLHPLVLVVVVRHWCHPT